MSPVRYLPHVNVGMVALAALLWAVGAIPPMAVVRIMGVLIAADVLYAVVAVIVVSRAVARKKRLAAEVRRRELETALDGMGEYAIASRPTPSGPAFIAAENIAAGDAVRIDADGRVRRLGAVQ